MPLEPIQELVAKVIAAHPEYHSELDDSETPSKHYSPEDGKTNPFLHMGMHIAIQEQRLADRPAGFAAIYNTGLRRFGDAHGLEHRIMECLGEALWSAQRNNTLPDEQAYLDCVRKLVS